MKNSVYEEVSNNQISLSVTPLLRTLALTGLLSTVLLIMVGSFVRVSGNGLGCPDWPLCYGRAVPPSKNLSAWIEFSHRLLGGIVSLQIVAIIFLSWRHYRNNKLIWRTAVATGLVLIVQVSLGGLHVLNELPSWTGLVHTAVAMGVAGLLA
ncbi:MAG: COX15/CtaA family protein, partial [Candidatus Promineifilaceae bacterium]